MRTDKLLILLLSSFLLFSCNSNEENESKPNHGGGTIVIPPEDDEGGDEGGEDLETNNYLSASASYGSDNSVVFGEQINKDNFKFTLKYEKEDIVLDSEQFSCSLSANSTFTNENIEAILTYKKDPTITTSLTLEVKPRDSLKLLFIGNSFSDDTIEYMYQIADSLNIDLLVENMFIGGCTIATHYKNIIENNANYQWVTYQNGSWVRYSNIPLSVIISGQDWDYISFQQGSGSSGVASTYEKLGPLLEEVKKQVVNPSHTQFVWNMTWAYQSDSTHSEFPKYNSDQMTMYNSIINCVKNEVITKQDIKTVIANGTAIQNARTSYYGDHLTRDGYHLSLDLGRYIAGLNAIKSLTGVDIDKCEYAPVGNSLALVAKESVNNSFLNKYEITNSQFNENPFSLDKIKENHHRMDLSWQRGYWNAETNTPGTVFYTGNDFDNGFHCSSIKPASDFVNGTIIYVKEGYKYRPEGWSALNTKTTPRPNAVTVEFAEVDSNWVNAYAYRAFNVSRIDGKPLSNDEISSIESGEIFAVYLPNE